MITYAPSRRNLAGRLREIPAPCRPTSPTTTDAGGDNVGAICDDLEGHEGYGVGQPVQGAADGVLVAECRCGWTGGAHPDTEDGYEALLDDWDRHHARPLLARTLPAAVADLVAEARRALGAASAERPQAVLAAADDLAR